MNIERLNDFTDNFLAELPPQVFSMDIMLQRGPTNACLPKMIAAGWSCGVAGCIAGLGLIYKAKLAGYHWADQAEDHPDIAMTMAEFFELDEDERKELFYGYPVRFADGNEPKLGWKAWMLIRLRHVVATKTVEYWRNVPGLDTEDVE